jgi:chromosome segregation ATPase
LELLQKLEELEQSLNAKCVDIQILKGENKKFKDDLWSSEYKYNSLKDSYDRAAVDLDTKEKELSAKKKLLADREEEIVNYQSQIIGSNENNDKLKIGIAEKDRLLDKLSKELLMATERVNYLTSENDKLKGRNACLESFYEEKDTLLKQLQIRLNNQQEEFGRLGRKSRI